MRMAAAAGLLVALTGCDSLFGLRHKYYTADEPRPDATIGMAIDAPTTCPTGSSRYGSYGPGGSGLLAICVPTASVPSSVHLSGGFDTDGACDTTVVIDTAGTTVCVRWGVDVTLDADLSPHGSLP